MSFQKLFLLLGLISIGLVQCNPCGQTVHLDPPVGIDRIQTYTETLFGEESSSYKDVGIYTRVDFLFAAQQRPWRLISGAYACSPAEPFYDATQFIDSILVYSSPNYTATHEITDILNFENSTTLSDYNSGANRQIFNGQGSGYFFFSEPPLHADSFAFSLYYFKDGVLIDSSFTQNHYISPE